MDETTYVYIVHSDINENNIYAEFATEEEAIEYAKRHIDELTYVDKVEALLDDEGDIREILNSETIWVYDEEPKEYNTEIEDDYWDQLAKEEEDKKDAEGLLGDTTWFEDLDTDALVETLEENEDIVECKECFELFPKEDCIKLEVGYLCPHCYKIHCNDKECSEDEPVALLDVADEDVFKVDFPEAEKFSFSDENEMIPDDPTPEVENEPISEPECVGPECEAPIEAPVTKEETIDFLVKDEEEAIDGYEKAKVEIEANPELDEQEKEKIFGTLDHIKGEEAEHIEELEELVDEPEESEVEEPIEEPESEDESEVLVEGSGFFGKVILDDYFKKDGGRNPENKNGTGYWVDLYNPDTKQSNLKPADKKVFQTLKEAEKFAANLSIAEDEWALIKVENAQGWNGILKVYEKGKCTQDISKNKLDTLNKAWEDQEKRKKARQAVDKQAGKEDTKETEIEVKDEKPGEEEKSVEPEQPKEPKNAAAVKANKEYKKILSALKKTGIDISKLVQGKKPTDALKELRKLLFTEALEEHINEEPPAVESEQVLQDTDNAVVDCKVAKVVTHSEDEKPVDCKGEKPALEEPLAGEEVDVKLNEAKKDDELPVDPEAAKLEVHTMLNDLVADEIEAINGYDDAKAQIIDTPIEHKDSILDTIDHIKEEEQEHIDELIGATTEIPFDKEEEEAHDLAAEEESLAEDTHAKYAKPEGDRVAAYNNALKYAKKENKPFIYGYTNHTGKFFAAETPMKVTGKPADAEKEFRSRYKNCNAIYVVYPDKDFIKETLDEKSLKDSWKPFNYKDYNGDEVVTVVLTDKRFEPLSNKHQREILEKYNVRIEVNYLNGTVVTGRVSDIIQACIECHIMNPTKIFEGFDEEVCCTNKDFITESKFTKAEQDEYHMDEDGNSLDSYDEFVRCGWCDEICTKHECAFEKDFGWLCNRCQDELKYHGGHLDIIADPTEEDIERAENNK